MLRTPMLHVGPRVVPPGGGGGSMPRVGPRAVPPGGGCW
jgi:hypothetical protein